MSFPPSCILLNVFKLFRVFFFLLSDIDPYDYHQHPMICDAEVSLLQKISFSLFVRMGEHSSLFWCHRAGVCCGLIIADESLCRRWGWFDQVYLLLSHQISDSLVSR